MIQLDMRSNIASVMRQHEADTRQIAIATYRALNRATDKAATETSREIRKVYNVRHRAVMAALRKLRAGRSNLRAQMHIEGFRIPLIEFDAHWRPGQRVGATARIKVGGARTTIPGAFIAQGRHGPAVFKRKGKARGPIYELLSVSVPQAFLNKRVLGSVNQHANEMFLKTLIQQLRFLGGE
jgi:hypothetical protein